MSYFCVAKKNKKNQNSIMKTTINVILVVCACALAAICIRSITDDQKLDDQMEARKKVVIARLLDIKAAEEAYKETHDTTLIYIDEESQETRTATMGAYAETFEVLIDFLKNTRYPEQIIKEGQIQEKAQRAGWTEAKVATEIYNLRKQGMSDEKIRERLEAEELPGVWCDTVWAENPIKSLYGRSDYPVDSLCYIPFSNGQKFELGGQVHYKMGIPMNYVMECKAPFETYLRGLGKQGDRKLVNKKMYEEERGAYPGLQIGDIANWNNNAGNWE